MVLYSAPRVVSSRSASTSIGTSWSVTASEHLALMRAEVALDRVPQVGEQLRRLEVLLRRRAAAGISSQRSGSSWTSRPCHARRRTFTPASSSANLYAHVVKRLSPRKSGSWRSTGDERVVGALLGEVVARRRAAGRAAAVDLEARRLQQQRVQLRDRGVALAAVGASRSSQACDSVSRRSTGAIITSMVP